MKKLTLLFVVLTVTLSSCLKDKLNSDEKNFLKISINGGAPINFDYKQMDPRIMSAAQNADNREVFVLETTSIVTEPSPIFWVCFRTDLPTGQTNPIMQAMPGDDAYLKYEGKIYRLYNGTVNLKHFDLESFGYSEGSFQLYLRNEANAAETISVDGSFYGTSYTQ